MIQSVRAAFMRLRRSPGFVIGATLSLAIGMALGTAVFSIVDAVMLRPLPFGEPDRVGRFYQVPPQLDMRTPYGSALMMETMRAEATALSSVAASRNRYATVVNGEQRLGLSGEAVTPNYFETLQARPQSGRLFRTGDVASAHGVVISHEFWTSKLAADSNIIGRALRIVTGEDETEAWHVVGVLPPGFSFPDRTDAWFVLDETTLTAEAGEVVRRPASYAVIGRLAPNAAMEDASVQVNTLFKRLYASDSIIGGRNARMMSLREFTLRQFQQLLEILTAVAILILLLCAVNFATMSLARGMRRRAEIAVRAALGASRLDIIRELVTEALLLASMAGGLTVLLAWWLISYSAQLLGGALKVQTGITWTVVLFGVGATILIGFIFALAPAAELAKVDLRTVLQGSAASTTSRRGEMRGQRLLVALQLSLALASVATVTALIQAERNLFGYETKFDYEQLVFVDVYSSDTAARLLGTPLVDRLTMNPGIGRIAVSGPGGTAFVWDQTGAMVNSPRTWVVRVSPNIFDLIGVRLVAGRLPSEEESLAANAYVVSASFARRVAGTEQAAVGVRLRMKVGRGGVRDWMTIVGVVPDVGGLPSWGVAAPIYSIRVPNSGRSAQYVMAVGGDPNVRAREITKSLRPLSPRVWSNAQAATAMMAQWTGATKGRHLFLIGIASLALLLAIVGVYGMTSYTTEVRLREFGIRIALGANAPRLARAMISDVWWMAPLGVGAGLFAAARLTVYLDALYRNPLATQPLVQLHFAPTAATAATLVVIAIAGTSLPLRRVLRLDVMRTVQGSG